MHLVLALCMQHHFDRYKTWLEPRSARSRGDDVKNALRQDTVSEMATRQGQGVPKREMGAGIAASPHLRRAKDPPVFVSF